MRLKVFAASDKLVRTKITMHFTGNVVIFFHIISSIIKASAEQACLSVGDTFIIMAICSPLCLYSSSYKLGIYIAM